jgi:hypothetical protein
VVVEVGDGEPTSPPKVFKVDFLRRLESLLFVKREVIDGW